MNEITNKNKSLSLGINLQGGSISYFKYKNKFTKKTIDILRAEKKIKGKFNIIKTAGFPLTPFCNRINKNSFKYKEHKYNLTNNTNLGKYYLHGDGWLNKWQIKKNTKSVIQIFYQKNQSEDTPYSYLSNQQFSLNNNSLRIDLTVKNLNKIPLPFGLGFHPYLPKNELTLLQAKSNTYWIEDQNYIPKKKVANTEELNFNKPNILPSRWTNNCFNNWNGNAKILWPDKKLLLNIKSSKNCKFFFLHVSSKKFEKNFKNDYFCFEPMTHAVNAHNMDYKNGLVELEKNKSLKISILFQIIHVS